MELLIGGLGLGLLIGAFVMRRWINPWVWLIVISGLVQFVTAKHFGTEVGLAAFVTLLGVGWRGLAWVLVSVDEDFIAPTLDRMTDPVVRMVPSPVATLRSRLLRPSIPAAPGISMPVGASAVESMEDRLRAGAEAPVKSSSKAGAGVEACDYLPDGSMDDFGAAQLIQPESGFDFLAAIDVESELDEDSFDSPKLEDALALASELQVPGVELAIDSLTGIKGDPLLFVFRLLEHISRRSDKIRSPGRYFAASVARAQSEPVPALAS
jgi:hypothetical protein